IEYKSNFQPFIGNRDVKDGKDEDLTQEPEMIRAFRDTWELGIHSYLAYLRDRLLLSRELLSETGSIFVQINDENLSIVQLAISSFPTEQRSPSRNSKSVRVSQSAITAMIRSACSKNFRVHGFLNRKIVLEASLAKAKQLSSPSKGEYSIQA